jgi:hypothetical protein
MWETYLRVEIISFSLSFIDRRDAGKAHKCTDSGKLYRMQRGHQITSLDFCSNLMSPYVFIKYMIFKGMKKGTQSEFNENVDLCAWWNCDKIT